jgi:hypothetical protein
VSNLKISLPTTLTWFAAMTISVDDSGVRDSSCEVVTPGFRSATCPPQSGNA